VVDTHGQKPRFLLVPSFPWNAVLSCLLCRKRASKPLCGRFVMLFDSLCLRQERPFDTPRHRTQKCAVCC
jgi:hypothetical protein